MFSTKLTAQEQSSRTRINLDFNWQFYLGDEPAAKQANYQDQQWRTLDLPHDWSIEGEYKQEHPAGIRGGFLPTGTGWYRKHLAWDDSWADKRVILEFDGVYMNSEVWVNGQALGKRPYGYISFSYDITEHLQAGNNVIAVRVDNSKAPSGRWYTGSGIYRHVWLTTVSEQHIPYSGVFVRSENVSEQQADVKISTEIKNTQGVEQNLQLQTEIIDAEGKVVAMTTTPVQVMAQQTHTVDQQLNLNKPALWSIDNPNLYTTRTKVLKNGIEVDRLDTTTGLRTIDFTVDKGFLLNGETVILQGISMHHDAGPVGAAVPEDVLRKRLQTLKAMGVNALRNTHNPFAPEFYQMANEMGFVVMNEAFDGWWDPKAEYDYGLYFDQWWQQDLTDFMRRDRNHPSVIMWSVGNEVPNYTPEQQKTLVEFAKKLDATRPITQGRGYAGGYLSIAGFNGHGEYKGAIQKFHKENPNTPVIGTEMTHTIHTRGIYRSKTSYRVRDFPAPWEVNSKVGPKKIWQKIKKKVYPVADLTEEEVFTGIPGAYGSSFDNSLVRMPIREEIKLARELPYLLGTFRWTAFDYIGESFGWPARTANFGVLDLAGFPKGAYYLYQSQWSSEPMVHLDPHWTHPGKEGTEIPVVVYTNQQSAELFLNGKSLGEKNMTDDMQLVWLVPYQAGELTVVAKNNGRDVVSKTINTAGKADSVAISADKIEITANKRDVVHLEIDVVDEQGNPVPDASDRLHFKVDGPARLIGVENGDILDLEPHKVPTRKAFMGKVLALIQATEKAGKIKVTVSGEGLKSQQILINASSAQHSQLQH
ncbi:glycoside hydrolase family 2 TIM barrel-domain containing protein [Thalassotalea fonticola]|uniref:Glycoside hydrolase family 2 TIM barrel-domain containing protein n=1 Tax=Thalassotalea fonticola TaxID=3065649 RepID=A0ABZ0GJT3_9GAMM|nr:glycoside hydrolase family 2 TIM barrel-domain containing protein [Colwelliaceae bacterium S1-1]